MISIPLYRILPACDNLACTIDAKWVKNIPLSGLFFTLLAKNLNQHNLVSMQKIGTRLSQLLVKTLFKEAPAHEQAVIAAAKQRAGRPFILDHGHLRFLYFDEKSVQSVMRIDAPLELLFGYTRAMMAFLFLKPAPKHILLIGLGGGSLLKFCYHHLPTTRLTALEIDPDVIALRKQFCIPDDNERLQVVCADAIEYLRDQQSRFDLILLDGFDIDGLVAKLHNQSFYAQCYQALSDDGLLVCNMWGQHTALTAHLIQLRAQFERRVWWGRSSDSHNLISFACKNSHDAFPVLGAINPDFLPPEMGLELQQFNYDLHRLPHDDLVTEALSSEAHVQAAAEQEWASLLADVSSLLSERHQLPSTEADWIAQYE